MAVKEKISILYDGDCPFCKRYVSWVRLKNNFDVELINARDDSVLRQKATQQGYNLDIGMLVEYQGKFYFANQAMLILSSLSTPFDLFNRMMIRIFTKPALAKVIYPVLAFLRGITVLVLQNGLIDNVSHDPHRKWLFFTTHRLRDIFLDPEILLGLGVRLSAFCFAFSILASWPVWFLQQRIFLAVPIIDSLAHLPFWITQAISALSVVGAVILFIWPRQAVVARILVVLFAFLVLQDEIRWIPNLYMYAFVILTSSFIPRQATQNDFSSWRYMIVGVYFWAGFYKINTVFVLFVFPWFVSPFLHNETLIYFLACVTPFVECAIGVCLFFQRTRVIGVLLATCMLVIVLICLGPLGHNWGMIVWPWNVWLHILELVLFMFWRGSMVTKDILCDKRTLFAILLFWLLPCLAIVDKWGQNPSFMLYSGIPTTSFVQFDKHEDLSFLPAGAQSEIEKGNQINLMYIMLYSEHMATEPSLPGQDFIIKGARGICPHLLYPEKAKIILYTLPHVWIVKVDQKSLPLCSR